MYYILIGLSALLCSIDFSVNKLFQKSNGASLKTSLAFNSLLGLFTVVIMFAINGFKLDITPFSVIMSSLFTLFIMSYNVIGFKLLKIGSLSQYTLYLMVGGMIVPYIFGLLFLNEPFTILRFLALVFVFFGVKFSNKKNDANGTKSWVILLYIAVFLLNGGTSVVSKIHQINTSYKTVGSIDFVILTNIFRFAIAGIMFLFAKKEDGAQIQKKSVGFIALSAVFCSTAFLFQLISAAKLPATVLFPFMTGGTIIFSALCGKIFFKEAFTKNSIIGIALCFIGTLLFL